MRIGPTIVNIKDNIFKKKRIDGKTLLNVTFNLVNESKKNVENRNIRYHNKTISFFSRIYHRKWL